MPEHQCKPHPSTYGFRGVGVLRIWEDRDEDTQQLVKIHTHIAWQEQHREIWMDGRPHPPEYAPHTWQGFSTGSWEGDVLVVKTTHLKAGWMRRNGLPLSDRATMTDRFHRYGDLITHVMIVEDPVYLTEPLVKTNGFLLQPAGTMTPYPCDPVIEIVRDPGFVPHYLPGQNPFLAEFAETHHLPPRSDARRRGHGAARVRGDAAMTRRARTLCSRCSRPTLAARPTAAQPPAAAGRTADAARRRADRSDGPVGRDRQRRLALAHGRRRRKATTRACRSTTKAGASPINGRKRKTARAKPTAPPLCCACRRGCAFAGKATSASSSKPTRAGRRATCDFGARRPPTPRARCKANRRRNGSRRRGRPAARGSRAPEAARPRAPAATSRSRRRT